MSSDGTSQRSTESAVVASTAGARSGSKGDSAIRVIGPKAAASVPGATPSDIPWLKLNVSSQRGNGVLTGVTTVQRINTQGGKLEGACDKAGTYRSAPYSADYLFLRKG